MQEKDKQIRKIKRYVKSLFQYTDLEVNKWWNTPNDAFRGKSPREMSEKSLTFSFLKSIVFNSDTPIDPPQKAGHPNPDRD